MSEKNLQKKEDSNTVEVIGEENSKNIEEPNIIETLTSEIEIKERKPRGNKISILITMGLIFGPISLIISLFSSIFDFLPLNPSFIFSAVSIIFLISSVISAKSIQ